MKAGVDYIGVAVGAMIFNSEGKVFIAQRGPDAKDEQGKWEFPGGRVEVGESLTAAIKREVKEEHDIDISVDSLVNLPDHGMTSDSHHWLVPVFICHLRSGEARIMEPRKCSAIKWTTLKEVERHDLSPMVRKDLEEYIKEYGYQSPQS